MRIDRMELREIGLQLKERFEISSGGRQNRQVILVRLDSGDHTVWAECVAAEDPSYSYETTETAWHILNDFLAPAVVGREFAEFGDILGGIPWLRGHPMAVASVEMASWALEAERRGTSLQSVVGGTVERVPVGVSIGIQARDEDLFERVEGFIAEGYHKIKIKIKPGRDVDMLRNLRDRFPDTPFMADANSAYTLADVAHLKQLDDLDLMMIEQPLAHDDLRDHARLQDELETPICLDESIRSLRDVELALELGSGKIINIKPGRVGGFASSIAIHDYCVARGVPVWCGGMLESGVGRAYNLALASLPGFTLPGDISASARYWARDIVDPEFTVSGGHMEIPTGSGIGVAIDTDRIESLTERVQVHQS